MKAKLRRAGEFSAQEWALMAQAWGLILAIDLGLRFLRFSTLRRILQGGRITTPPAPQDAEKIISEVTQRVGRSAAHHLYPMTCLRRSLTIQWLLKQRGVTTELRFGVQKDEINSGLRAHAWLERDGHPVSEPEALTGRFARLAS